MTTQINIFPRATEKAYGQSKNNVYVFDAPVNANKQQITKAVETQFGVKVVNIKTLIQDGKAVRASKGKRARPGVTFRKDSKKAYVTLAEGNKIKVFDEPAKEETKTKVKTVKKEKK
jgi:large subunit ribosomal protein L23